MPRDVLDYVDNRLAELELPHLATHNIEEDKTQIYTSVYPNLNLHNFRTWFLNSLLLSKHHPKHIYYMGIKHYFLFFKIIS